MGSNFSSCFVIGFLSFDGDYTVFQKKETEGLIMKKLVVDQDKCIGCGTCVAICPEVFKLGENGKAEVKLKAKSSKLKAKVEEAIDSCPVEAIKWEE